MGRLCNIPQSIHYVYNISKVFAMFPFKVETVNGVNKITRCRYSYMFTFLTAFLIFGHGIVFPFFVYDSEINLNQNKTTNITSFRYQVVAMKIINRVLITMMSLSALSFALFYSSKFPSFFEKLDETDYYLRTLVTCTDKKVACCVSLRIVLGIAAISVPALCYYLFTEVSRPDSSVTSVTWLLILMWDNLSSTVCEAQFVNLSYLLGVRFRVINKYLRKLNKLREANTGKRK